MVRDLTLNIAEGDLRTEDKSSITEPIFDVVWGELFDEDIDEDVLMCNVIIPEVYESLLEEAGGELDVRFSTQYVPNSRRLLIRLVVLEEGGEHRTSEVTGQDGLPVTAYLPNQTEPTAIQTSQLICLNPEGKYIARFKDGRALVCSARETDMAVCFSDNQSAQLLSLCAPGKHYRYPSTGVGITSYLNSVIEHTDFQDVLAKQFEADGKSLISAVFDNSNCDLDVLFSPEKEKADVGLADVSELDMDFFRDFTDPLPITLHSTPIYNEIGAGAYPEPELPISVPSLNLPKYVSVMYDRWLEGQEYHFRSQNETTGLWEISVVRHNGCVWRCIRDTSWIEPQYPSRNWEMLSGFFANPDFSNGLDGWTYESDIDVFALGGRLIWANDNFLSYPISGTWMDYGGDTNAVTIYGSFLTQKGEDLRGLPRIREKDGVKNALPIYITVLYKVVEPGHLTMAFENTDDKGFVNYQHFAYEADLDETTDYTQLTAEGMWNGTGDFTITFTGKVNIRQIAISTIEAENLI